MKFLLLNETVTVRIEDIQSIETIDQLHTKVYMSNGNVWDSFYPKDTLKSLLQIEEQQPATKVDTEILKKLNVMAENSQLFVG